MPPQAYQPLHFKLTLQLYYVLGPEVLSASLAQLVEHALRKRMVMGSIPIGGCILQIGKLRLHESQA